MFYIDRSRAARPEAVAPQYVVNGKARPMWKMDSVQSGRNLRTSSFGRTS